MDMNILYEDNHLLIIENPDSQNHSQTYEKSYLKNALKKHLIQHQQKKNAYLRQFPLNEYPVCGTRIFVKSSKAFYRLIKQKKTRRIKQLYFAVVKGNIYSDYGTLTNFLLKDRTGRLHIVTQSHPQKFHSTLSYIVVERTKNFTLIAIPSTHGNSEQIRIQLMAWGHSISGEDKYCWNIESSSALALCTVQVRCYHPTKNRKMNFICPLPLSYPWNLFVRFSESRDAVHYVHQQLQSHMRNLPVEMIPK
ncbi:hypothetical protein HZY86_00485 [Aerococcaceae bacterium DSM 111020]|nr:hypothetical protein [Aerococcaceae bacterium DSM 111020]